MAEDILGMPAPEKLAEEVDSFREVLDALLKEEEPAPDSTTPQRLAHVLDEKFQQIETDRRDLEERWLTDLRQYKGEYEPEILARIHPKRSKAYLRLTRTKVKTVDARLIDLLFPGSGEKNWGIQPSRVPMLNPEVVQQIQQVYMLQTGQPPSPTEIERIVAQEAKNRCERMSAEIEDQLGGLDYRGILKEVIHSGNLYGTGILKGPLVKEKSIRRWFPGSTGDWEEIAETVRTPYAEFVAIWDFYPDMTAKKVEDCRHIFQRHVMTKHRLEALAKRTDFDAAAIEELVRLHPEGNSDIKNHEEQLRSFGGGESRTNSAARQYRFDVKEFWGYLTPDELTDTDLEIPEEFEGKDVPVNVWYSGGIVIKKAVVPMNRWPYYTYYFDKDETSIFGEGVASIMRDPQTLANAAVRAMLDNAAISAGPLLEANLDLLPENEDPTDLYPFRVFLRTGTGVEASYPAIRVTQLPSYTKEYQGMLEMFMTMGDEVTTFPRYMYGEASTAGGASRTASGMSMLMGAANITLKDLVKHFDDGITSPFIEEMYAWNMDFSPKEEIKGDFEVIAKGTSSLIAKEVRAESLTKFIQMTSNPVDLQYTKRQYVLREVAKVLDLDGDGFVKTDQEIAFEQEQAAKAQAAQQAQELQMKQQEAVAKALAGGHLEDDKPKGDENNTPPPDVVQQPGQRPQVPAGPSSQGGVPPVSFA